MEASNSWFTGSAKLVVFSTVKTSVIEGQSSEQLTSDSSVFETEKLSLVVASDGWVGVNIAR